MCYSDKTAHTWYLRESLIEQAASACQISSLTAPSAAKEKEVPTSPKRPKRNPFEDTNQQVLEASPTRRGLTSEELRAVEVALKVTYNPP